MELRKNFLLIFYIYPFYRLMIIQIKVMLNHHIRSNLVQYYYPYVQRDQTLLQDYR